ncbi:MAG: hypothetical protein VCA36_13500 [Opitutales bacterium]
MDSIFDNLLPLLLILAYFFSTVFRKKKGKDDTPPATPSYPSPDDEPDSLREEIKRRFQERSRQLQEEIEPTSSTGPPVPAPVPSSPVEDVSPSIAYDSDKALRSQQARMKELHRKAAENNRIQPAHADSPFGSGDAPQPAHAKFRKRLRSSKSLREAIILMEILGPPLSLCKSGEELRH